MPVSFICVVCGKTRSVPPSTFEKGAHFCSMKCYDTTRMDKYDGKKKCTICKELFDRTENYFYKNKNKSDGFSTECRSCCGNLTLERVEKRQRFVVGKGLKCESCGMEHELPNFFDIDHIIPVRKLKIKRGRMDYNDENLQILCPNCHRLKTINDRKKTEDIAI